MAESRRKQKGNQGDAADVSLYARQEKIYVREVHGIFAFWRTMGVVVLLGLYYGVAWLNRDGRQALLFDLPERKFHVFGLVFWPQDFFYMAALMIIMALSLFFFTAIAGRLWCGYACPQTVWTELFMWIERRIEGDRMARQRLDQAPMSGRKFGLKFAKHAAWVLVALYTGFTFVGYFTPIRGLTEKLLTWDMGAWEAFWIFFYSFATWGNAGFMREDVCIYMCPYARFQSAMFDADTLVISYDENRGEPRGSRKRGEDYREKGLGDCIDCTLCVQVCPTGIDIRDGLQYQCIACAACIDVCDGVMEKMEYPKGLIRYTTENAMKGKRVRVLRPRVLVYATILAVVSGILVYSVATRVPLQLDVIRDRISLYRRTDEGMIQNVYLLKILNMDAVPHEYRLAVRGIEGIRLDTGGRAMRVIPGEVIEVPVTVFADPADLTRRSVEIEFDVEATDNPRLRASEAARFLGPVTR